MQRREGTYVLKKLHGWNGRLLRVVMVGRLGALAGRQGLESLVERRTGGRVRVVRMAVRRMASVVAIIGVVGVLLGVVVESMRRVVLGDVVILVAFLATMSSGVVEVIVLVLDVNVRQWGRKAHGSFGLMLLSLLL
jgi:hypothetical protein